MDQETAFHLTKLRLRRLVTDFCMPPGISEAWCERLLKEEALNNFGALTFLPLEYIPIYSVT